MFLRTAHYSEFCNVTFYIVLTAEVFEELSKYISSFDTLHKQVLHNITVLLTVVSEQSKYISGNTKIKTVSVVSLKIQAIPHNIPPHSFKDKQN